MDKPIPEWLKERITVTKYETVICEPIELPCDDCGIPVVDRRVVISQEMGYPKIKCKFCGMYRDPLTGEFSTSARELAKFYSQKHKEDK